MLSKISKALRLGALKNFRGELIEESLEPVKVDMSGMLQKGSIHEKQVGKN